MQKVRQTLNGRIFYQGNMNHAVIGKIGEVKKMQDKYISIAMTELIPVIRQILLEGAFLAVSLAMAVSCSDDKGAMRERLEYVSQCNRADTVFTEAWLSTVDSLVSFFDRHGNANERMMAHYLQGRVHHDMGEVPIALECYQKATEMADTTRKDCDLYTLYAVYGQMASIFHAQYLPTDEMLSLRLAERIAWKDKDTLTALWTSGLMARPYYLKNDTDSVLFASQKARNQFLSKGQVKLAAQLLPPIIHIAVNRQQYDSASHYIRVFESESGRIDKEGNLKGAGIYYYDKGRCLMATGNLDSAMVLFHKSVDTGYDEAGYRGLLCVYSMRHMSDSIAKYAELFAKANDSSFLNINQQYVEQVSASYNFSRQQRIAERKEREAVRWMAKAIATISIALLAILSLLTVFYRFRARRLQEINDLTHTRENLEMMLAEKENSAIAMRKEVIRLNNKNSNIHRTHSDETSCLRSRIAVLQQKLADSPRIEKPDAIMEETIYRFKDRLCIYRQGDVPPNDEEWRKIEIAFDHNHHALYCFITSRDGMTLEHVRVCIMAVLEISEGMMAFALLTNSRRIDRLKRQANRRLFGEEKASTLKPNLRRLFE